MAIFVSEKNKSLVRKRVVCTSEMAEKVSALHYFGVEITAEAYDTEESEAAMHGEDWA